MVSSLVSSFGFFAIIVMISIITITSRLIVREKFKWCKEFYQMFYPIKNVFTIYVF